MSFNKGFRSPTQKRISAVSTKALEARACGISRVRELIEYNLDHWPSVDSKDQQELISAMNFNVGQVNKELKSRNR